MAMIGCQRQDVLPQIAHVGQTTCRTSIVLYSERVDLPATWKQDKHKVRMLPMESAGVSGAFTAVQDALSKYPPAMLSNLREVVLCGAIYVSNVEVGGLYDFRASRICVVGGARAGTSHDIEASVHHEFSSLLFWGNRHCFDLERWRSCNEPGFEYSEDAIAAIEGDSAFVDLDTTLARAGFINQYATTSLENDVNEVATHLFASTAGEWHAAKRYSRVARKVQQLIAFYQTLDPSLSPQYFEDLPRLLSRTSVIPSPSNSVGRWPGDGRATEVQAVNRRRPPITHNQAWTSVADWQWGP